MADEELITTIDKLVAEEHEIRSGEPDPERLAHLEETLDQCWDLLRQRRAKREYDQPDTSDVRPPKVVEGYQQ